MAGLQILALLKQDVKHKKYENIRNNRAIARSFN